MADKFEEFIDRIKKQPNLMQYSEADTKQTIILPLLGHLCWDFSDRDEVRPEYSVAGKRVDYALILRGQPKVFIEAKRIDQDLSAYHEQLVVKEEDFYGPFADWLVNELEDCTKAIPLGGNRFKDKWGTPDVVGKNESKRSDIIQGPVEIVSAEIKTDANQFSTAFGQTCSYRLFSHKVYLVIPLNSPQDDIARLDSLCMVFSIGLILFNPESVENPEFDIRVRAKKHDPDMYYVNKNMKLIEKELFQ